MKIKIFFISIFISLIIVTDLYAFYDVKISGQKLYQELEMLEAMSKKDIALVNKIESKQIISDTVKTKKSALKKVDKIEPQIHRYKRVRERD